MHNLHLLQGQALRLSPIPSPHANPYVSKLPVTPSYHQPSLPRQRYDNAKTMKRSIVHL
ncbi:9db1db77-2b86-44fe-91f9-9951559c738b [Sclerotinia trifoliorum]|uniref:9db1db77-2b86-44fe-91f9-9951559c738b n=1 Tax=Sclerotinia trifoliorum TaxID=28548 RepID=A0A8H2VNG9_9HELO|nr:9db1db77-2b86-44fe-91f9-9951559c738b [Sclerotinia trifoliorum]